SRDRGAVPTAKRLPGLRLPCCAYVARPCTKRQIWMEPDGSSKTRTARNPAGSAQSLLRMMFKAPGSIPGGVRVPHPIPISVDGAGGRRSLSTSWFFLDSRLSPSTNRRLGRRSHLAERSSALRYQALEQGQKIALVQQFLRDG